MEKICFETGTWHVLLLFLLLSPHSVYMWRLCSSVMRQACFTFVFVTIPPFCIYTYVKVMLFCNETQSSLVDRYRYGGTCFLHLQASRWSKQRYREGQNETSGAGVTWMEICDSWRGRLVEVKGKI
jgi:hypothetical protein